MLDLLARTEQLLGQQESDDGRRGIRADAVGSARLHRPDPFAVEMGYGAKRVEGRVGVVRTAQKGFSNLCWPTGAIVVTLPGAPWTMKRGGPPFASTTIFATSTLRGG